MPDLTRQDIVDQLRRSGEISSYRQDALDALLQRETSHPNRAIIGAKFWTIPELFDHWLDILQQGYPDKPEHIANALVSAIFLSIQEGFFSIAHVAVDPLDEPVIVVWKGKH